jgi:sugar lactone lactonase YvrE
MVVTLGQRALVEAVGYSAIVRERNDRPRDVAVYTSADEIGDAWTLRKELRDIAGGEYEEILFDQPVVAKRVRFDMLRVWSSDIDGNVKAARGHLGELYVYGTPQPLDFTFVLSKDATVSGQILDGQGRPVRTLFPPRPMKTGTHGMEWDGLNDRGERLPDGDYQYRIVQNPAIYITAGTIGNTAIPRGDNQNPTCLMSVVVDAKGNVFTANMWEEAGQDFRMWDRDDGHHLLDARYAVRNGEPNGMPYGIAVDDRYIYCTTTAHGANSRQHIRRFNLADGQPAPFPAAKETQGHIFFCEAPEKNIPPGTSAADVDVMALPLRGLAVTKDKIFVTDGFAGKVCSFNKATGAPIGSFAVALPHALAVDRAGRLWVGHGHGKVTVFSQDGKQSALMLSDLGHVAALAFGPDDVLYVADSVAGHVQIYRTGKGGATLLRTFGQKAKPGDNAPDRFHKLTGLAVDAKGNMTVAQNFPISGARLTRFAPDGKVLWDHLGIEFCSTGNYSQERPGEVVSQYFHRYAVDKKTGTWAFRGYLLDGEPKYINWQHGVMRLQRLGKNEFLFQSYGDGLQVYRREGEVYRLAAMFGSRNPMPDGVYWDTLPGEHSDKLRQHPFGLWSWHDENGNGKVDDAEISWFKKPGESFDLLHFGVNVDKDGNGLLCDHVTNAVFEMPMVGLDGKGNPMYDFAKMRQVIAPDPADKGSRLMSQPLMAVRAEDGSIYVHGRSDVYPVPSGHSWTCGWLLARYDQDGVMLWYARLPEACPGMDVIPGGNGGVVLVSFQWKETGCDIFQYSADGLLIGVTQPAVEVLGHGGIPDNVASLAVSRDPRDGILDVFIEDCIGNRFRWQRIDDREKPVVITGNVVSRKVGNDNGIASPGDRP